MLIHPKKTNGDLHLLYHIAILANAPIFLWNHSNHMGVASFSIETALISYRLRSKALRTLCSVMNNEDWFL